MVLQNYTHMKSLRLIEVHTEYLHQMVFFLIMKVLEEVKHLLPEK